MKCRNQNRPSPFPGQRSKKATKPGFIFLVYFMLLCYGPLLCSIGQLSLASPWESLNQVPALAESKGGILISVGW